MSTPTVASALSTITSLLDHAPVPAGVALPRGTAPAEAPAPRHPEQPLTLRVLWGGLTEVGADIHVAGHYQGVLPASAEQALDAAISSHRGVIAEHTRRRWLVGELGEVAYFPGRDPAGGERPCVRRAAVVGMGRLGTLTENRAKQLYGSLLRELGALTDVRSAATVLIGSGAGNLSIPQAARAMVSGFAEVLTAAPDTTTLTEVVLTETDRLRAEQLLVALANLVRDSPLFRLPARVEHATGGTLAVESAAVLAIRTLTHALRRDGDASAGQDGPASLLAGLVAALPDDLRELVPAVLRDLPDDLSALSVAVGSPPDGDRDGPPTRIAVSSDGDRFRWAALTERATIPERVVPVKPRLVDDLVRRLTAPVPLDAARLPGMLRRWVIPEDFQSHIAATAPLVLEVNGAAARLPWEFLTDRAYESGQDPLPLAVRTPIARQLRTTYSRAVADYAEPSRLRALVVADPGPPDKRLTGAKEEGIALAGLLRERGVDVSLFVGPPGSTPPDGANVATELDVLTELLVGRYDIVHFAGHGTMPEQDRPELAGWLFSDGVLSARELSQMTWAPRLVTANACWTASTVGGGTGRRPGTAADLDDAAALTAVLADEFLRVGVAHYIGTSWEIPDEMGRRFALSFYEHVLPTPGRQGEPFGRALCAAREVLFGMRGTSPEAAGSRQRWSGWAAYQHYGDPADVLDTFEPAGVTPPDGGPTPGVAAASGTAAQPDLESELPAGEAEAPAAAPPGAAPDEAAPTEDEAGHTGGEA